MLRCASVHLVEPNWFDRVVLGREERDFHAVGVISRNGGVDWYEDGAHSFRRITDRVVLSALNREYREVDLAERKRAEQARHA